MIWTKLWLKHYHNSRNKPEIVRLKQRLGHEGKSAYWDLIEIIHEKNGYLLFSDLDVYALEIEVSQELLISIIKEYNLFQFDDNKFWDVEIINNLENINERRNEELTKTLNDLLLVKIPSTNQKKNIQRIRRKLELLTGTSGARCLQVPTGAAGAGRKNDTRQISIQPTGNTDLKEIPKGTSGTIDIDRERDIDKKKEIQIQKRSLVPKDGKENKSNKYVVPTKTEVIDFFERKNHEKDEAIEFYQYWKDFDLDTFIKSDWKELAIDWLDK